MKSVVAPAGNGQSDYVTRLADARIDELLAEAPAVFLVGPRAAGKTTTAARHAASVVRLDGPDAPAFVADPDAALVGLDEPVLIDEWQVVPDVLGAVKRAVDSTRRPGRFIVTGSVRARRQPATWPGTGRLIRVTMYGLTERELIGRTAARSLIEGLVEDGPDALPVRIEGAPNLLGYVERIVLSGFPEAALHLRGDAHPSWLDSYVEQVVSRDVEMVDIRRDPDRLRRYFQAYAACTARVVDEQTLLSAAGINRRTAAAYEAVLRDLFVVEPLDPWFSNRLKRLVRAPRRHVVEPALAATALGLDAQGILREGAMLGPMLKSYVVAQIRAEAAARSGRVRLHHLRDEGGRHEIDVIVEAGPHRVVGIEVKAGTPTPADARHLRWLRDRIGTRFVCGVVLHTGRHVYELDDRVFAAPIAALWS